MNVELYHQEKMFGNDVALLLGMTERGGEKEERKRADEEKIFFNGGFWRGSVSVFSTARICVLMDHYGFLLQAPGTTSTSPLSL